MSKVWFNNALRGAVLVAAGLAFVVNAASAVPRPAGKRRAFNLFSGVLGEMNVNRFRCGIDAFGKVCVDPGGSSTVPGGFWPKGTPDAYVFNSGLQLAGIIDPAATGFAWASDTVGAFFFDPKGTTEHGSRLSLVWNSLDPGDNANWPRDAYVPNDPTLFDPLLIGRKAASQQDTWMQYWDGDPAFNAGRRHPLGVLVTQRGMAWNFPGGNEDIIYYLYSFTNVSASDPAAYAGLPNADSLANLGARFQQINEAAFDVVIPNGGYAITNMYAAFAMDADVSDAARENYSTAFFPFSMGMAFKSNWHAPEMLFPGTIFGAPFVPAPGIVGVKYLRSPVVAGVEVGLTMFSNTINGGQFDDAQNATQLWRYLAARLNPSAGDAPCNAPLPPDVGKVCFVSQDNDDVRFFQSSGPLSLAPGETKTIVVAYIAAAPVGVPAIAGRSAGFDLDPGWPAQAAALSTGADTLRSVDRVFGAVSILPDANANGRTDQTEVQTVPRSLLNKGLVAQAVFDGKFLLPFPPDAPAFFVVPGNNQVTVVWQPSPTEASGDPYYQIASQPTVPNPADPGGPQIANVLYDPNYRRFDVEGYRVYRGRTTGALELVAQFDYAGRQIFDFTAAFDYGNCAPELGVTVDCPADLATGHAHDLSGDVIQVPRGGRVELATPPDEILVLQADTAVTGGASGNPALNDNGVPFAFVDRGVRNSFRYFYAVTAFDVNSVFSVGVGNTALESARVPKEVTPRASSGQQTAGSLGTQVLVGANGQPIPAGTQPDIDAGTGIFTGPQQPTNGVQLGLAAFLPEVLADGAVTLTIDSIVPGASLAAIPATYYVTAQGAGAPSQAAFPVLYDAFDENHTGNTVFQATSIDGAKAAPYGGSSQYQIYGSVDVEVSGTWKLTNQDRGNANAAPANSDFNGPRWWTGATNENTPDPVGLTCPGSAGGCVQADLSRNAGSLPGVAPLFHVFSYATVPNVPMRDLEGITSNVMRAADIAVYWGAGGAIDSVRDVVHRVPVPFKPTIRASWGFLNAASFSGTTAATTADGNNGLLTWSDIFCVAPAAALLNRCGGSAQTPAVLMNQAQLSPVAATSATYAGTNLLTTTGNGFIFYLNGHFFLMQMAALPADGTVWFARFYAGTILGTAGSYTFVQETRPPSVPGLGVQIAYEGSSFDPTTTAAGALDRVHTVPDPYYVTNAFEQSPNTKILRFVNLPARCIIRIYSQSGILVNALTLDDATGGGELTWNLRNRNNQFVASGVYFYHVEAPDGQTKTGRFTIVNFAQ